jgi:hypothetical protein
MRSLFADRQDKDAWPILGNSIPGISWEGSGAWNLASIFYNDFKTVEAKYDRYFKQIRGAPHRPWREIQALGNEQPFNLLDGPLINAVMQGEILQWKWLCEFYAQRAAMRRAARVVVAINRYHASHGHCPAALEDLVPGFLSAIPVDPFCGRPLHYDGAEPFIKEPLRILHYELYSCSHDGRDDGGVRARRYMRVDVETEGDLLFPAPRGESASEPDAEPISTQLDVQLDNPGTLDE